MPLLPKCDDGEEITMMDLETIEIAHQLTLIEDVLFRKIKTNEFAGCAWNKKDNKQLATNITKSITWFNKVSRWVKLEILTEPTIKRRGKKLQKLLKVV